MRLNSKHRVLCLLALAAGALSAAEGPGDDPLMTLNEGHTYRTVNGEAITGKDVMDVIVEESWEKKLEEFTQEALCVDLIESAKINVSDAEVESELKYTLDLYGKRMDMKPEDVDAQKLAEEVGGLAVLRKQTRVSLGVLRLLQQEKKLPADAHISGRAFADALSQRLEKIIAERGVVRDPRKLGAGEGLRIGSRSYSRDEVRQFIASGMTKVPRSELQNKLDVLQLEKLVRAAFAQRKLELSDDDVSFHFSYLCRRKEAETGVPGRVAIRQELDRQGMSPEQFTRSRVFNFDAMTTRIAKSGIAEKDLKAEFAAHPGLYRRNENMIAHIFAAVFDPDGQPYSPAWNIPGQGAVNSFVAKKREEQFAAAKPKIEGLFPQAKQDFEATAKKYSEDSKTASSNGIIGRIGPETIIMPPCDAAVRAAAVKLKPGEISEPVRSDYGWHLLKCLEKQEVSFDEAAERVYLNLIFEARKKLLEGLLRDAKVEEKP